MCTYTEFGPDRLRFAGLIPERLIFFGPKSNYNSLSAYNNSTNANVCGAIIMAKPFREFTRFMS